MAADFERLESAIIIYSAILFLRFSSLRLGERRAGAGAALALLPASSPNGRDKREKRRRMNSFFPA